MRAESRLFDTDTGRSVYLPVESVRAPASGAIFVDRWEVTWADQDEDPPCEILYETMLAVSFEAIDRLYQDHLYTATQPTNTP